MSNEQTQVAEASNLSAKLSAVMKTIEELTVLELADLVKALEERFGVSAAAAVAVAGPAAGGAAGGAAAVEEKTAFDVVLASAGDKKIQVIKEIRAVTSLGLKEAKDLVDGAPKLVKAGVSKEEADKIKKILEEQGAKVEIK
ncbi:MAG: 50S ribosomal protein L7/L12 [Omnitrophica bacterium GWA2_52_12]|nr:MAG: 50S ribosomal protein L7/L12 [Omnitrophica bacterium GWA2_52_12]